MGGIAGRVEATGRGVVRALQELFRHPEDCGESGLKRQLPGRQICHYSGLGQCRLLHRQNLGPRAGARIICVMERGGACEPDDWM